MKLSVIIPTLNERSHLPIAIDSLRTSGPVHEIIVVDGESDDGTYEWARSQSDVTVLRSPRNRGRQLRLGAERAGGDVLWFLYADCAANPESVREIERAMRKPRCVAGVFPIRFAPNRPGSLALLADLFNMRSYLFKEYTGSQALFTRRVTYEVVGGHPEWPMFEDGRLAARLKRLGKISMMESPIDVSARRYLAKGVFRTTLLLAVLHALHQAGASPFKLKASYPDIRDIS